MPLTANSQTTVLVHRLAQQLIAKQAWLCTAESCTGGLLAASCTDIAGSSQWFERGFITYSNAAKSELLGVPDVLIQTHGAVSEPVASAMAQGALAHSRATLAVSVTGIAGPAGGTALKPVGTVCFGFANRHQTTTSTQIFVGDRQAIRQAAVIFALSQLCQGV